jgi:hypothetical protein
MYLLSISEAESIALIARCAAHLPIGASLGRVLAVSPDGILAEDDSGAGVMWGPDADRDAVWRLLDLSDGLQERTLWHRGEEIGRHLIHGGRQ